jgi:hypothetical protein
MADDATTWKGSKPELAVYLALQQLGLMEGRDFNYQSSVMGGRLEYGGAVLDFVLPGYSLAINVQSVHYHYADPVARQRDAIQRASIEATGLRIIYIDEADALRNAVYYVQEALRGVDHSLATD